MKRKAFRVGVIDDSDVEVNGQRMEAGLRPIPPKIRSVEWTGDEYPPSEVIDGIRATIIEREAGQEEVGEPASNGHLVVERGGFCGLLWDRVFGISINPVAESD